MNSDVDKPIPTDPTPSNVNQPTQGGGDPVVTGGASGHKTEQKLTKKEFVLREAREILFMIVYLFVSLSIVATFRCLVLAQHGINDFEHSYIVAVVLSIALGKIVVIGQKLPVVNALNSKPLILSVLYKALMMSVLAYLGSKAEERLFPNLHASTGSTEHHLILVFTRECALYCIFVILFVWRDLDRVLGHGTLFKLFFRPRNEATGSSVLAK